MSSACATDPPAVAAPPVAPVAPTPCAFASDAFVAFAAPSGQDVVDAGVLSLPGLRFPYLVVARAQPLFAGRRRFVVTPICLCGPSTFDLDAALPAVAAALPDHDLAGGFIQTRAPGPATPAFRQGPGWCAHLDARTNYRLPLGLSAADLEARMKRDSRGRVRQLLRDAAGYRVVEADGDAAAVRPFAQMYAQTAQRAGFPEAYRFDAARWQALLQDDGWRLYYLERLGRLVSGAVVARVETGFDYTFMAYADDERDASRANILFLYRHLSQSHRGCLDLGGGIAEDDALARFKLGLGAQATPFLRLRFAFAAPAAAEAPYRQALARRFP